MTGEKIAELKTLARAAETDSEESRFVVHGTDAIRDYVHAASPPVVLELIAEVELLQAEIRRLEQVVIRDLERNLASEYAKLHAVRVLDAWSKKHGNAWAVDDITGGHVLCIGSHYLDDLDSGDIEFECQGKTAAEARSAAAKALLEEDPELDR